MSKEDDNLWFRLETALEESGKGLDLQGIYIKGQIDDVLVVKIPSGLDPQSMEKLVRSAQAAIQASGIKRNVIVVPEEVQFLKAKRLSQKEAEDIERKFSEGNRKKEDLH